MAARLEPAPAVRNPDLVDLRKLSSAHMDTLLEEETGEWNDALDWDFRKSACSSTKPRRRSNKLSGRWSWATERLRMSSRFWRGR